MTTARRYIPGRESPRRGAFGTKIEGYQRARRSWVCLRCLLVYRADEGDSKRKADKPRCDRTIAGQLVGCGAAEFQHCASGAEALRLVELARWLRNGGIEDLRAQPSYPLHAFAPDGSRHKVGEYRADFAYLLDGALVVEDVKPKAAQYRGPDVTSKQRAAAVSALFNWKRAHFEIEYGVRLRIV